MGLVKYSDGNATQGGNASSPNSFAIARAYRSNIDGNIKNSNKPSDGRIYPAGYTGVSDPAYFLFDVGSSAWNPAPNAGDISITVLETYTGQNGWNGPSYVAGVKSILTQDDLKANGLDYNTSNAVMEQIPTPTLVTRSLSTIEVGWNGLWDNNSGLSGGADNNTVTGYSVYRSDNQAAYVLVGSANQTAGQSVSYEDSSVVLGHSYTYKLKVRFEWSAHSPAYYESIAEGSASAQISPETPNPDRIAFTTGEQSITAGTKSNVMIIQSRDVGGNDTPVLSDTTIDLSSNSNSVNKHFYSVDQALCTNNVISSVVITSGNSTAQFCYYDESANSSGWTLTAHKTNPPEGSWLDGTQNIVVNPAAIASFQMSLTSPQSNKTAFSGVNTLTAFDTYGNIKTNFNAATDNITFSFSPIDGTLSGLAGASSNLLNNISDFTSGVANVTSRIIFSGTSGNHTFTATSSTGKTITSNSIFIQPATATHLSVIVPASITAGTQFNITTITALDEFNNIDTNYNGNYVVNYSGPQNSSLGNSPAYTSPVNFTNGVSTTALSTTLVKSETTSINVTVGGLTGVSNQFTVQPEAATSLNVSAPATVTAGVDFNINPITAYDQFGNIDTNYTGTKTLNYSGPSTGPTSGSPRYTTQVAFVNGSSTTTLVTQLVKREVVAITIGDGNINGVTSSINVSAGQVGTISYVSGNNQTATINTFLADPFIVEVKDIFGNLKNNYPVPFVITKSNGFLSISNPLTASDGRASQSFRLGSVAGVDSDEVQVQIDGAVGSPIIFKATATPTGLANLLVSAPNTATAGVQFNLSLSLVDAQGNLISDFTGTKVISYSGASSSPSADTPNYTTSVDFTNGTASVPTTLVKVESVVLSLNIAADNLTGTSNPILVNPATTMNFTVVAPTTVQSGVSFNLVSIKTIDQFGNFSTDYNGEKTLVYSGPGVDPVTGSSPTYTTSVNFANSEATTILATKLFKAESVSIRVKDGVIEGTSNFVSVSYADYVIYYVSGNAQTGVAGQQLANSIKVIVLDSQGNPALDKTVIFTVTTGGGSVVSPNTVDQTTGEVSTTWTLGTAVGTQSVVASVDGLSTTITFTASAVSDSASIITVSPPTISTFENYSTEEINICLQDQFGNRVVTNLDRAINLNSTSSTGEFATLVSGPWGIHTVNIVTGQSCANVFYKDSTAGSYTFTASANSLTSGTISITVAALIPTSIIVSPANFTINENNSQQMSAVVYDQFNHSMININLTWEMNDANAGTITPNGLYSPTHTIGTYTNAIKVSYSGLIAYSTPTVTTQPVEVVPTPVVVPVQPQITPSVPSTPTAPVVINVDQNYFSDNGGTIPVTVEVPVVAVLSPKQGAVILSNGHISISGTSIPDQIITVKDGQNNTLGSVTSDKNGYWKLFLGRNKFPTDQGTIKATVFNTSASTTPLTFDFAPRSIVEYVYDLIFNN
ncbi:MAG: beta strand repeat-containing protein [Candidatus Dojkabacteria bacterium]